MFSYATSFQLCAIGWHLVSQTKMAVSDIPNLTGRENISTYVDMCQRTSLLLAMYKMHIKEEAGDWEDQVSLHRR